MRKSREVKLTLLAGAALVNDRVPGMNVETVLMRRVACNLTLPVRQAAAEEPTTSMEAPAAATPATTCSAAVLRRVADSAVLVAAAAVTEGESKCAA